MLAFSFGRGLARALFVLPVRLSCTTCGYSSPLTRQAQRSKTIEAIDAAGARVTELLDADWKPLLNEYKLEADKRHFVRDELLDVGTATHLRLNIFPDGGISRLRAYGKVKGS